MTPRVFPASPALRFGRPPWKAAVVKPTSEMQESMREKKLLKDAQMKRAEDILTTICPQTNLSPLQCLLELLLNGKTQQRGGSV